MTLNYGKLVIEAIQLLDTFKPGRQCLDDFIEEAGTKLQTLSSSQKNFVLDIVSGCVEHKKLLDIVINGFYKMHGKNLFRRERSQFDIVCYLATFALDDIGLQCFSSIVQSLHLKKMFTFLSFFISNLNWIQDEWSNIYEAAFVVEQWIDPLFKWRPEINILLEQISEKISQEGDFKKVLIQTTVPQEFIFSKSRPCHPPSPEIISDQHIRTKPVPESTYVPPKEFQKIEEVKEKNRQQLEELLLDASEQQFRCANTTNESPYSKRVKQQIEEEKNSKLKFNSFKSSACPSIKKTCPIKLNKAAIRRQEAQFDRQLDEEIHRLEKLQEGHNPSSFLQWQKEMLEKDLLEKRAQEERQKIDSKITNMRVVFLRQKLAGENQKTAQQKKEETAQLMKEYAEKRFQEEKAMRDLVQQITEGHKNPKAAKEKLKKLKQSIVREVAKQNQELLRQELEKTQAELRRRFEIIQEIHSIETLPLVKFSPFDKAETAGHMLLNEMSVMELNERLVHLKNTQKKAEEDKRKRILEEKREQKQLEQEMLDTMSLRETIFAQARVAKNAKRKERREQGEHINQLVAQDETIIALKKTLQEASQEIQRLKENERKKVPQPRSNRQDEKKNCQDRKLPPTGEEEAHVLHPGLTATMDQRSRLLIQRLRVQARAVNEYSKFEYIFK